MALKNGREVMMSEYKCPWCGELSEDPDICGSCKENMDEDDEEEIPDEF